MHKQIQIQMHIERYKIQIQIQNSCSCTVLDMLSSANYGPRPDVFNVVIVDDVAVVVDDVADIRATANMSHLHRFAGARPELNGKCLRSNQIIARQISHIYGQRSSLGRLAVVIVIAMVAMVVIVQLTTLITQLIDINALLQSI